MVFLKKKITRLKSAWQELSFKPIKKTFWLTNNSATISFVLAIASYLLMQLTRLCVCDIYTVLSTSLTNQNKWVIFTRVKYNIVCWSNVFHPSEYNPQVLIMPSKLEHKLKVVLVIQIYYNRILVQCLCWQVLYYFMTHMCWL